MKKIIIILTAICCLFIIYYFTLGNGRSTDQDGYYLGYSKRAILLKHENETVGGLCNQELFIQGHNILVRENSDSKVKVIIKNKDKTDVKKDLKLPAVIKVGEENIKIEDT